MFWKFFLGIAIGAILIVIVATGAMRGIPWPNWVIPLGIGLVIFILSIPGWIRNYPYREDNISD